MATDTPKIMIVMPTYNETENLPIMVEALFALIDNLHLLVVDDNSPDGTGELAEKLAQEHEGRISVLHREQKAGLGPAYVAGLKQALKLNADYLIQMDADFSHQPKYLSEMVAAAENHDLVLGSRYVNGGSVDENWGIFREFLSWWANRIYVPVILRIPIHDATGGFRLWRRETIIGLDLNRLRSSGYVFQVELAYIASRLGFKIAEVPIHFPDRERGISKMRLAISMEAALRVWQILFRHRKLTPQDRRAKPY